MLLNKKIAKLPKRAILRSQTRQPESSSLDEDDGSPFPEKKYVKRYRFKQIPQHSKYICKDPIFPIKGVIFLFLLKIFACEY